MMIVLYHLYGYCNRNVGSVACSCFHTMQIPIFMYVSGYFSQKSLSKNIGAGFIINRAKRLLFPFFSFMVIWLLISPKDFVQEVVMDDFKGGYWYVLVLFEMMALLALALFIAKRTPLSFLLVLICMFGLLSLYELTVPRGNLFSTLLCVNLLWHYFPFYILGYYHNRVLPCLGLNYSWFYFLVFILSQYLFVVKGLGSMVLLCNLSSMLFWISLIINGVRPLESFFSYLGRYSLQIYLIHFIILYFIVSSLPVVNNRWLEFGYYVLVALFILLAVIGVSKLLMKSRYLRLILFGLSK